VRSATAAGVPTLAVPHVVPVPAIPGSVRLDSLEGLRARDLLRVVSQGSAGDLPIDLPQQG
jgi:hypothetical protein